MSDGQVEASVPILAFIGVLFLRSIQIYINLVGKWVYVLEFSKKLFELPCSSPVLDVTLEPALFSFLVDTLLETAMDPAEDDIWTMGCVK